MDANKNMIKKEKINFEIIKENGQFIDKCSLHSRRGKVYSLRGLRAALRNEGKVRIDSKSDKGYLYNKDLYSARLIVEEV